MKKNLLYLLGFLPVLGFGQVFSEDFEGDTFPPTGWTLQQNNTVQTWTHYGDAPINGSFSAGVDYDPTPGDQNEWLITPAINFTGESNLYLNFTAVLSYYWSVDPNDNYDFIIKASTDGGTTWTDVWSENDLGLFTNWAPNHISVDISSAYANNPGVQFAFVYIGNDGAQLIIDDISITTTEPAPVFPAPYCAVAGIPNVEPITLVDFAGVSNVSPADSTEEHEDFTTMTANVSQGTSYPISIEGYTGGDYDDYVTVYIDWNQNMDYSDAGETYEIGFLSNTTGEDGNQLAGSIAVPADALTGTTRMRVLKNFDEFSTSPCDTGGGSLGYGQAEEYTVAVTALGVGQFNNNEFAYYPNPVKNILNLSYTKNISDVKIFNILGQEVLTKSINADNAQIDMSNLPAGNYLAKVTSNNAVKTIKVIKQ